VFIFLPSALAVFPEKTENATGKAGRKAVDKHNQSARENNKQEFDAKVRNSLPRFASKNFSPN